MNTAANKVTDVTKAAKARAARKGPSAKRAAAEAGLKAAKSDQEKTVARSLLKSVRFEELARARVRRITKHLAGLANLANRAAYTWTDEQADKILTHLNEQMKNVTLKFAGQKEKKAEFDL